MVGETALRKLASEASEQTGQVGPRFAAGA